MIFRAVKFKRYVISNRTDGVFVVTLRESYGSIVKKDTKKAMNVCKNCLSTMQNSYPLEIKDFTYNIHIRNLYLAQLLFNILAVKLPNNMKS